VFVHEFEIFRVVDHDSRWQSGNRDLKRFVTKLAFTLGEIIEELLTRLYEHKTVPHNWKSVGWLSQRRSISCQGWSIDEPAVTKDDADEADRVEDRPLQKCHIVRIFS